MKGPNAYIRGTYVRTMAHNDVVVQGHWQRSRTLRENLKLPKELLTRFDLVRPDPVQHRVRC